MSLNAANQALLQVEHKKLTKNIARCGTGAIISTILALWFPWTALSAGINAGTLARYAVQLRRLRQEFKNAGLEIEYSVVVLGICQAAIIRFGTTAITLGHEDLVGATCQAGSFLNMAGAWIAEHMSVCIDSSDVMSHLQHALDWDQANRMSHGIIKLTTKLASSPVEAVQHALHIDKAADQIKLLTGWDAPLATVAKQFLVVGPVQASVDWAVEKFIEDPVGHFSDRGRAWCQKKKEALLKG
ncbi:hypothetical protein LQW54_008681 [Pestalotiopsis sp. IQ-011]